MAGGLVGLFDDIAALAKLAASSVDDVAAAAGKVSIKAAGVVVDDAAVTPAYVRGLAAERELPIIKKIAIGSLRNKLVFILPVALLLSAFVPVLVEIILMFGGTFLAYEGAHKVIHALKHDDHDHDVPAVIEGDDVEAQTVRGAIRTDFILSAEIIAITLGAAAGAPFGTQAAVLALVALAMTVGVYGLVAGIVKLDDLGLALARRPGVLSRTAGGAILRAAPWLMKALSVAGTAAMFLVGGGIIVHGWPWLHYLVQDLLAAVGSGIGWLVELLANAGAGVAVGIVVLAAVTLVQRLRAAG